jgi:DNA-binding NarL/FixJ family response regulator
MVPIRVLVANQPRLIRELVAGTISDQPDINVVGEIQQENELENAVEEMRPDVLIVALDRSNRLPAACESILRSHPRMRIIALAWDRNTSIFYRASLSIESIQIEASEAGVLGAIRGITQSVERLQ